MTDINEMQDIRELSKSRYCKGFQCPKILWLDRYKPEEKQKNERSENIMKAGTAVGDLAKGYFGEYSQVEFSYDKSEMVRQTLEFMESGAENIVEASFMADGLYCAVDILRKNGDGWDIAEVKSSSKIAGIYIEDIAFQYYVLKKCGINVKKAYILHINNTYVRQGELDIGQLFAMDDFTKEAEDSHLKVQGMIAYIRSVIDTDEEPEAELDLRCDVPYKCAYKKYCGKNIPEHSVFNIAGMRNEKKYELYHKNIITYDDILKHPESFNKAQLRQAESIAKNKPDEYDKKQITEFLKCISYPVYHLDFETFMSAVPLFDGCRPYEQIPFQYSLHIEQEDGSLDHREFLAKEGTDPRRELAERLTEDIPADVCVTAYNMIFEKGVIKRLAELFPDLEAHLMNIHDNIRDLMIPFQKRFYYSAAMDGSYSIKNVLPALFPNDPELDYHNLEGVQNGEDASSVFASLAEQPPEKIAQIRAQLLRYCCLDTYAMVKVHQKLREAAEV